MALELDERQRAMLQEMGVPVWQPGAQPTAAPTVAPTVAPASAASPQALTATVAALHPAPSASPMSVAPDPAPNLLPADLDWSALVSQAAACQACGLCAGRRNSTLRAPVQARADWLIVGDPPDEDEDRLGLAFAEQAGVLLDNMLRALGVARSGARPADTAYATTVVKCRPPQGRNPAPAELVQCATFLQREVALLRPKVILAMGRFAIQTLLAYDPGLAHQPLGRLRGQVYQYQGVPVVVTYPPKLLLRASADKAKAWADLCLALDQVSA